MNEKVSVIIWISICCIVAFILFYADKFFGKRRADKDCDRARDLNERAGENNRSLEEKERRTRELIEESRAEVERARELVERQDDDYSTAEKNNRRAKELIGRAKEILADDNK
jgi:hypothetical protein